MAALIAILAVVACKRDASGQQAIAPRLGSRVALVSDNEVWRVRDGDVDCYVVVNERRSDVGAGISCVRVRVSP